MYNDLRTYGSQGHRLVSERADMLIAVSRAGGSQTTPWLGTVTGLASEQSRPFALYYSKDDRIALRQHRCRYFRRPPAALADQHARAIEPVGFGEGIFVRQRS